jgi:hypothetical protein
MQQEELTRPKSSVTTRVSDILERLNIHLDSELIEVVVAATEQYYFNTPNGRQELADRCMMEVTFGESDMEYHLVDTPVVVGGKDICFLSATVIGGRFVAGTHVDAYHKDKNACDMCNANVHCTISTKDEYGKQVQVCNSCLDKSDVQRLRDLSSGLDGCRGCTALTCQHNPNKGLDLSWLKQ